ncbi:uncharacterized protein AAEQ78_020815 isoform 2-T2 [Lycaon pictus]
MAAAEAGVGVLRPRRARGALGAVGRPPTTPRLPRARRAGERCVLTGHGRYRDLRMRPADTAGTQQMIHLKVIVPEAVLYSAFYLHHLNSSAGVRCLEIHQSQLYIQKKKLVRSTTF